MNSKLVAAILLSATTLAAVQLYGVESARSENHAGRYEYHFNEQTIWRLDTVTGGAIVCAPNNTQGIACKVFFDDKGVLVFSKPAAVKGSEKP